MKIIDVNKSSELEDKCVPVATLIEMKISAIIILEKIKSDDAREVKDAMREYSALVDRFYQANEHLMAPEQYRVAKMDFEYFLRLLALAIQYSVDDGSMHSM